VFLEESDHRVDDDDRADCNRIEQFAEGRGQDARAEQEPDDGTRKLAGQQRETSGLLLATDFVRTELGQSPLRFRGGKAVGRWRW